jgi:signal transduction histidine kinase
VVLSDITEINSLRGRMVQHTAELLSRTKEMDMIISTVAHDLKNPISSMIGYASLIQAYFDRMERVDILEAVQEVIDSGYHMHKMIDALLLLATLDKDDELPCLQLNTHRIIENVYHNLDSLIREKHVRIDHPENWPLAYGYDTWVETIWTNFISNAIKYGGNPPRIVLGAKCLEDGRTHFWVQDNGNGLTAAQQAQIFKPFVRLDGYQKSVEGHGLGLTIVRKILDRIKSEIVVESEINRGSRFGFILPRQAYG